MVNRRTLLSTAAGAAAVSAFFQERPAFAATSEIDVEPRGADGRMERLGTQELESQLDFNAGFRLFQKRKMRRLTSRLLNDALIEAGIDPRGTFTYKQILEVADSNPMINLAHRAWMANQQAGWKRLQDYFHANTDMYLSEMEANDKVGPGTLELSPDMYLPEYTRHEIHTQPGGYVGDPFAGHVYHYNTNAFHVAVVGGNEQDQHHKKVAGRLPLPADGKVKRILDMGTGIGQMACALKERFPDAEVWGVDIAGPMVRYAHMRANDIGIGANFRQALAEETGFPDGYFDLVTSYIVHHEVPAEKTKEIVEEAHRVLRPGGVYTPQDFVNGGTTGSAFDLHFRWFDHRWNNEVWSLSYHSMDFTAEIAERGFKKIAVLKPVVPQFGQRNFVKA